MRASHESDEELPPAGREVLDVLAMLPSSTRIASICTGAFVLAAAGLLDGQTATTHWLSADLFRVRHPGVLLDPAVLFAGNGRVFTSAGEAAGIDLCLHLVRDDHGVEVANDVARRCIVPPHRDGGQAQYFPRRDGEGEDTDVAAARAWALARIERPITLAEWAGAQALSVRSFTRRFRDDQGSSPGQWLTEQRVDRACFLLETTDDPVDDVASGSGFGTAASLRHHLRALRGVSPQAYRRTFRSRSRS